MSGARLSVLLAMALAFVVGAPDARAASLPGGAGPSKTGATKKKSSATTRNGGRIAAPVILFHINHRETLRLRIADDRGRPLRGLQQQVNRFLRCHYTKRQHAINPRLTRLIYETGRHFAGRRIEVVSGYRHPRVAKNKRSPHMKCLACDMRVSGVKNTELRDFFRQRFKNVGVGYYPNSSFVHLDVRKASAFWIDYSGPGENALYARDAYQDLATGRADRWRRSVIPTSWADEDEDSASGVTAPDGDPAPEAPPAEGEEAEGGEAEGEAAGASGGGEDSAATAFGGFSSPRL